jgi:hypothetical protein
MESIDLPQIQVANGLIVISSALAINSKWKWCQRKNLDFCHGLFDFFQED